MNKQIIIDRTVNAINLLPEQKAIEISNFADFIFKQYEESQLIKGSTKLYSESEAFQFLEEEEEIYSIQDLREVFND